MTDLFAERRTSLARIAKAAGLDALALVPGSNFLYLTGLGFHLMERPTLLFVTDGGEVLGIIPELEREKWSAAFPGAPSFYWQDSDGYRAAFAAAGAALRGKTIGIEAMRMRAFEADALRQALRPDAVVSADAALAGLRLIKSPEEIASLRQAIAISEAALGEILDGLRPGQTEREIASRLKLLMLAGEADGLAFEPLVLAGANAANPHGVPGDRPLRPGEALLIDFGAAFGGMNADITRTFFCTHVSDRHAEIYTTVLRANAAARALAGPGRSAEEIDAAATGVLAASDFAPMIVHKTGHGLGMDVHEAPQIMKGNAEILRPGMVFTIEPGLYQGGEIGVRIEDDVAVSAAGCDCLTAFPRDLRIIGRG